MAKPTNVSVAVSPKELLAGRGRRTIEFEEGWRGVRESKKGSTRVTAGHPGGSTGGGQRGVPEDGGGLARVGEVTEEKASGDQLGRVGQADRSALEGQMGLLQAIQEGWGGVGEGLEKVEAEGHRGLARVREDHGGKGLERASEGQRGPVKPEVLIEGSMTVSEGQRGGSGRTFGGFIRVGRGGSARVTEGWQKIMWGRASEGQLGQAKLRHVSSKVNER